MDRREFLAGSAAVVAAAAVPEAVTSTVMPAGGVINYVFTWEEYGGEVFCFAKGVVGEDGLVRYP